MASNSAGVATQIYSHLASKGLAPRQSWLHEFINTQKPTTALAALKQTALFRLLATDITTCLELSAVARFPPDILNGELKQRTVPGLVPVQILDIEDVGSSKWSQVESIEATERGEKVKGREIIQVVAGEEGTSDAEDSASKGPHKLLVQDATGVKVYGFEMKPLAGLNMGMSVGSKMTLKNATVARGVLLLDPDCAALLGGKLESLQQAWREGQKARLKQAIGAPEQAAR